MFFKDRQEYEAYLEKNKINDKIDDFTKYFEWSDDGEILLDKNFFKESSMDVENYTNCISWILLKDNETMALLKYQFGDIYRDLSLDDYYMAMYNNILLPQIANQLQNQSAKYFIAKNKTNKKNAYERKYILTLDFKTKDEEIIHGEDMLEDIDADINELNINELANSLETYLKNHGYNNQDIQKCKIDFVKQSFFNRFIKQTDENNHNWGILVNEKTNSVRMAPMYDMECSCDIRTKTRHIRKTDDGSTNSLEHFINQYKDEEWFKNYIQEVLNNFDLDKAFENAKTETNTEIPNKYKERYRDFFALRFQELKQAYNQVYMQKEEKNTNIER